MTMIRNSLLTVALILMVGNAPGQTEFHPHVALFWLDWVAAELSFATEEAGNGAAAKPNASAELLLVQEELAAVRREMAALRSTLDEYLGGLIAAMQQENEALRQDLARTRQAPFSDPGVPMPQVPRPEGIDPPIESAPAPPPAPPAPTGPPPYEVLKEWGRTPEVAAELGSDVAALKGMVLVIPTGTPSAAIEELGRTLRDEFDAYENINIDVFDDADAAAAYADHPSAQPARRVLTVSRQADAGHDTILITENGITTDIPR